MSVEITVPSVGESIEDGLLTEWLAADGQTVATDDPLFVLETDKVTITVNAEASGRLERVVEEGETVQIGQVVGRLDPEAAGSTPDEERPKQDGAPPEEPSSDSAAAAPKEEPKELAELSPSVRRLVLEHDLDPADIDGSGRGGRLTKEDVLRHLSGEPEEETPAPTERKDAPASPDPVRDAKPESDTASGETRQTRRTMSRLRQRLAERLVSASNATAMLTTFNEVDMSRVQELRGRWRERFEQEHGVRLGLMSFFIKAVVKALQEQPEVNAFIEGDEIVENHYYDIGIAVSTERGLVVPVLRGADGLSFAGAERGIAELADKARDGKLMVDDLVGGVFTITNGGVFGSLLSTPILNPPQSAILGLHTIQKRPVVVGPDDRIEVRPMMYLALSYDHRLIDGREAVTFLRRIKAAVEDPERLLLEV